MLPMKLKLQAGIESYTGKSRTMRITPISQTVELPDQFGAFLLLALGLADGSDAQPGDGEVDIVVGRALYKLEAIIPGISKLNLPENANAFVRVIQVA